MEIKTESQYQDYKDKLEEIIRKGTALGEMELLTNADKEEFVRLTDAIGEWEAAYHPLPGKTSTLITNAIREKMEEKHLKQKETASWLGIPESKVSELLIGRRPLSLNIVKRLRDRFGIPADFLLDHI